MRLGRFFIPFLNLFFLCLFIAGLLLSPIVVDNLHLDDTALLAQLGWRGVNGFRPVIDFSHFYGGMTAEFVTLSFELFGVSYKSIHYAFAMMFAAAGAVLCALCWKRVGGRDILLLLTLAAALMVSLLPIEQPHTALVENISHAFVYNHAGIVLMMAVTVFALKAVENVTLEAAAAILAGIALYALILLKTTFGAMLPCIVLACLVQRRWLSALLVLIGAGAGMLLLDPGMTRALGSLDFLLDSAAADNAGGVRGRFKAALSMLRANAALLLILLALVYLLFRRRGTAMLGLLGAALVCAVGYLAAVLTMGGAFEFKLLPLLSVFAIFLATRLTAAISADTGAEVVSADHPDTVLARSIPVCLAYAIILPALVVSANAAAKSWRYADYTLVERGPYSGYFVYGSATMIPEIRKADPAARLTAAVTETARRIKDGDNIEDSDEYVVLAEGIHLLQSIPEIESYGIVSGGRMFDFTMPLGSKVVPGFPVWFGSGSLELADRLDPEIDLVMLSVEIPEWGLINDRLRVLMGAEFRVCRRAVFWTLYARRGVAEKTCAAQDPVQ